MKKLISLLTLCVFILACSTEEKVTLQKVAFRNTSNQSLRLFVLVNQINISHQDTLISTILEPNANSEIFSYYSNYPKGFDQDLSSIQIIFNNNKGYKCSVFTTEATNYCFSSKASPLDKNSVIYNYENGIYFFDITQEDYENAHVLE